MGDSRGKWAAGVTIFPSRSFNAVLSSIASANGRFSSAFSASEARSRFVDLSVPRRERQSVSGTGTVMEATKIRLEAVASLPGTDGSNPFRSSEESCKLRYGRKGRRNDRRAC